jgi:1,4-dihydroxy-2-naphthoyl-CoA synthase
MNALVGTAEENSTVAKVGEYMRAGDDDPDIRVIVLTGVRRGFCSGANLGSRASAGGLEQDHRRRGAGITGDSPAKVRFAPDSLLGGEGFEPSVPPGEGIFETAPEPGDDKPAR